MKPAPFEYYAPATLQEALGLLGELSDPKVLAGGQSLMPMLNMRLVQPVELISLDRIQELRYVRREGDHVAIGAMTRQRDVELDPEVARELPALPLVLAHVAHVAIRHRGTIGGSVAHADPSAELPLACRTLGAELVVQGPAGRRAIAAEDFFVSFLTTALEPGELLVELRFPVHGADTGITLGFEELARRHGDFAIGSALVGLRHDADGTVNWARIGLGNAHHVPIRSRAAEAALVGRRPSEDVLRDVEEAVASDVAPLADAHGSAEYRRRVLKVMVRRAIGAASRTGVAR
jgi:carbon-monoxide dehydrogenase medium subunit